MNATHRIEKKRSRIDRLQRQITERSTMLSRAVNRGDDRWLIGDLKHEIRILMKRLDDCIDAFPFSHFYFEKIYTPHLNAD